METERSVYADYSMLRIEDFQTDEFENEESEE
jgi:hypothetical protein